MRGLNEHKINPGNYELTITVLDEPGNGGANHAYDIEGGKASSQRPGGLPGSASYQRRL